MGRNLSIVHSINSILDVKMKLLDEFHLIEHSDSVHSQQENLIWQELAGNEPELTHGTGESLD